MALFMAFLMFSSSIGFSMDIHFCGNELKSFSFFGEAEPCEMMQVEQKNESTRSCCHSPKKEIKSCHNKEVTKGNCCHNERLVLDNGGEFESSNISIEQFQQVLFTVILFSKNFYLFETSKEQVTYAHYNPPPLIKDVSILHQVFRI
jgi:hypothetical protein